LLKRKPTAPDYLKEKLAMQDIARRMADNPAEVLPALVKQAMEICGADSAGISVLDGDVFRWLGLHGTLAAFEGATTPRTFSPCGVCLDQATPILMKNPERTYDWIRDANIVVPEVLLVPLTVKGESLGTLWIVAREGQQFDSGHSRVMMELATFTGIALQMVQADDRLKKALEAQETLAKELNHRVKNLFAVTGSLVEMTSANTGTKDEMVDALRGRLRALSEAHGLMLGAFGGASGNRGVSLSALLDALLRPFGRVQPEGPAIALGDRATGNLALVIHELATNAAKYGALSIQGGSLAVTWDVTDGNLVVDWRETGGPAAPPPTKQGFGSALIEGTIAGLGGTLDYDWSARGLVLRIAVPLDALKH
jgi:two-component sensor histidine kinase